MKLYEVTAAGFSAEDDSTDARVYWVQAASAEEVMQAISDTGADFWGELSGVDQTLADFILPQHAMRLSEELLTWASFERNKGRCG